ncbi:MAG: sigma-54-dependent Fis family transcriptional regulator [Blastocatellales bacterium]|nr:sigma-54-dependent Fis family transcriptional regulator [Blastocatellales bacterium]
MMMSERILIAEDNAEMLELLCEVLDDAGYQTIPAPDGRAALDYISRSGEMIDLVVTDVRMPGASGDQLLAAVRATRPETPVIVITAFGSVEQAVEMVKVGASQYLTKPFETRSLETAVGEALVRTAAQREQARVRRERPGVPVRLIGASRPMKRLIEEMTLAARSASTVLITGESGTGKEIIARAIHEMSGRTGAFVPVNCAAIPADLIEAELFGHTSGAFTGSRGERAGLIESADGGTLFLDEIGELPLAVQPKLLRALQDGAVRRVGANVERSVQLRVVAATNRDLEGDLSSGRFREDLYWRLNVIRLRVPPLRERPFDVPLLVEHFVVRAAEASGHAPLDVSPEALAVLTSYGWPGNVRELENAIERAVAFAPGAVLRTEDLPERVRFAGTSAALIARSLSRKMTLRELEREYILETLRSTEGNKARAADMLGIDRKTLYRKLDEYRADGSLAP